MKILRHIAYCLLAVFTFSACQKEIRKPSTQANKPQNDWGNIIVPNNFFKKMPVPGVLENNRYNERTEEENPEPNNGDDPVILGPQLANPYTIPIMQQAYQILYGGTTPVPVTHLYVRLKPSTSVQFSALIADTTLELQDFPMDYQLIQDGDYYQDPTIGTEDIGWLYTVVLPTYIPPSGIQYEIIQQLHIPPNDDLLLESMAESLAGGAIYSVTVENGYRYITRTDEASDTLIVPNRYPTPCEIDPCFPECPNYDPALCGGGGGGGGGGNNPQIPRGTIQVQDIRTCNGSTPITNVPVRQARVVCKRWFKIWKGYTNDHGLFVATRRFNNQVKILLKTENNNAKVSKIRGIRLWQILFPVKKRIGVFNQGAMANISFLFVKPNPSNGHDRELPYWVATTTHNSVLEYGQYAGESGVALPPTQLRILITNWGFMRGAGAAPLWNKCHILQTEMGLLQVFVQYFIVQPALLVVPIVNVVEILKNETDVIVGYLAVGADYSCRLTSASLKETTFHELGHTSHFVNAGCDYWQTYRTRISNELTFGNPDTRPYGNGTETNAGVVGLGEMWGNHIGYTFSNRHYGNGGANGPFPGGFTARMQGIDWENVPGGLNCYLNAIENHDPNFYNVFASPWPWIPQGVCYDLIDPTGEIFPVIDNVSGYTTAQCFNALQSNVRTILAFRNRLLQQNGNNQQTQVNALFSEYNY